MLLAGASMVIRRLILGWAAGDSPAVALLDGSGLWWLLLAALALAVWLAHWIPANRAARLLTMAAAAERGAWPRKAYFYLGQSVLLAAAAAQIVLALRAALLWLLGGADAPADAATAGALAGGGFAALAAWAYLRWENARDGDLGRESGRIVTLRRFYVYSFALVGLALAFGGAGETLRSLASLLARPLDASTLWREPLATAFAALSVGLPLTLGAWGTAGHAAKAAPAAETNALSRVVLRYSVLFGGTAVTLLSAGYLIEQVALLILRQPRSALPSLPLMGTLDWTHAVAYLPAAVIAWATYADGIREDAALGGEVPRTATARRLVRYAIAAAVLAAFWFGLTEFARLIIQVILGSPEGGLAPADGVALADERVEPVRACSRVGARGRARVVGTLVVPTGAGTDGGPVRSGGEGLHDPPHLPVGGGGCRRSLDSGRAGVLRVPGAELVRSERIGQPARRGGWRDRDRGGSAVLDSDACSGAARGYALACDCSSAGCGVASDDAAGV